MEEILIVVKKKLKNYQIKDEEISGLCNINNSNKEKSKVRIIGYEVPDHAKFLSKGTPHPPQSP